MDIDYKPDKPTAWRQVFVTFTDRGDLDEYIRDHLGPALLDAEDTGAVLAFWFIRKGEVLRVRLLPGHDRDQTEAVIERLADHVLAREYAHVIYEPETHAFGGTEGMSVAHALFHTDSRHLLTHLANGGGHQRELAVRLAVRFMRAAGLDFYEMGDVWQTLAAHRAFPAGATPGPGLIAGVQHLITASGETPESPLHRQPDWPKVFEQTGQMLAHLNSGGHLTTRGLRAVLAHHLLFLFNRYGVSGCDQALLASAAARFAFCHTRDTRPGSRQDALFDTRVNLVTNDNPTSSKALRDQLVTTLTGRGHLRDARIRAAFAAVPRELFLPGVELAEAYAARQYVTKRDDTGAAVSSASSPSLVADMLELLDPRPGQKVQEIGAATGINAALIAHLVGPGGRVDTIEYDGDFIAGARNALEQAGYRQVHVHHGDGALGHPAAAPYDRIIITAGAWDITDAWWQQLAPGGRIVVPLRLHESGLTRAIAFDNRGDGRMDSAGEALVCGFVPMRGSSEHDDHHLRLDADVVLKFDAADQPDRAALAGVLDQPRQELWTSITVTDDDPIGHLDLWLLVNASKPFARLGAGQTARSTGRVTPAYRWAGAAVYDGGTLSYLAFQPTDQGTYNLGVISHGPDAAKLGPEVTDLLHAWQETGRPNQPMFTAHRLEQGAARDGQFTRPSSVFSVAF
ncbi:methyltransferase, FxLD system [Longispora sp. K20-0274]|uniref:methyltransferase, FxLD system n=1 Tax=Longispora sp. K20-0274 TaxID=3088255 RepID=UPI00399C3CA1